MHSARWYADGQGRVWAPTREARERGAAVVGVIALGIAMLSWTVGQSTADVALADAASVGSAVVALEEAGNGTRRAPALASREALPVATDRETMAGGYLGVSYTHPSTVSIHNPGRTDMTIRDFQWDGRALKSPIYYGLRALHWPAGRRLGVMLDFTHAKAIARFDDVGTLTGTHEGKPLPSKAKVGDVFRHLEFSHGHNLLTLNGIARLGTFAVQPYVGAGAGIALPHTEIGFRAENGRTYEYQYAGLVGQALAGLEVRLGRVSVFLEYKFTYAPYDVPLSGVPNGWLLVTDLWRQLTAWLANEAPSGGRLSTTLMTHHAIGGALTRLPMPR